MRLSMQLLSILFGATSSMLTLPNAAAQIPHNSPGTPAAAQAVSYPDTANGLKRLGKDLLNALKNRDAKTATVLVHSMMLPDPAAFYHQTFGDFSGGREIAAYQQGG